MRDDELLSNIKEYCGYYNIPTTHLISVISDLKVVPMIRGKAFEYNSSDILKSVLSGSLWNVSNPGINAQSEIHDIDVLVERKTDNKKINVECKLSANGSFNISSRRIPYFKVKCMRSRTLSDNEQAVKMAKKYNVTKEEVLEHADSYRDIDFDFVITSIGNSLWSTENGEYIFGGDPGHLVYLKSLFPRYFADVKNIQGFQQKTFEFLLIARSSEIKVSVENGIICPRKKCIRSGRQLDCGFIPNYPVVILTDVASGTSPWKIINDTNLHEVFMNFLDESG